MATFSITDLAKNEKLDHKAMAIVHGGLSMGIQGGTEAADATPHPAATSESKPAPQDFHFFHHYDKASPVLG